MGDTTPDTDPFSTWGGRGAWDGLTDHEYEKFFGYPGDRDPPSFRRLPDPRFQCLCAFKSEVYKCPLAKRLARIRLLSGFSTDDRIAEDVRKARQEFKCEGTIIFGVDEAEWKKMKFSGEDGDGDEKGDGKE